MKNPKSRKWILSLIQFFALVAIPPLYKYLGVDADITLLVLTTTTAISGTYVVANTIAKKKDPND